MDELWDIEQVDVLLLTGAGLSTAAGVLDYHTIDREWPFDVPRVEATSVFMFREDPEFFWQAFSYCHPIHGVEPQPTPLHHHIAELENDLSLAVVTQNVDGLHEMAGSRTVLPLHGTIGSLRCLSYMGARGCGKVFSSAEFLDEETPHCPSCGAILKPDVSLYGEGVNEMGLARDWAMGAKVLVAIGTSLRVAPANEMFYLGTPYRESPAKVWLNQSSAPDAYHFDAELLRDFTVWSEFDELDSLMRHYAA